MLGCGVCTGGVESTEVECIRKDGGVRQHAAEKSALTAVKAANGLCCADTRQARSGCQLACTAVLSGLCIGSSDNSMLWHLTICIVLPHISVSVSLYCPRVFRTARVYAACRPPSWGGHRKAWGKATLMSLFLGGRGTPRAPPWRQPFRCVPAQTTTYSVGHVDERAMYNSSGCFWVLLLFGASASTPSEQYGRKTEGTYPVPEKRRGLFSSPSIENVFRDLLKKVALLG